MNAKIALSVALCASVIALPGLAQQAAARDCDWQASARNIPEPWDAHSRTFSNGAVRLAALDTVEPAAGAFWLLVLSPPYSELGDRQCHVIGINGMGFSGMDFDDLTSAYDPATGLEFSLPVQVFDGIDFVDRQLEVTLDQATGAIATRLIP